MVPVHARPAVKRSEFIKSLGTRDKAEAGRRALQILAEWRAQVDRATGKSPLVEVVDRAPKLTDADLDSIVVDRGYEHIGGQLRKYVIEAAADGPEALSRLRQTFERTFRRYNASLIAKDLTFWGRVARDALVKRGVSFDEKAEEFASFAFDLGKAVVESYRRELAVIDGQEHDFKPAPLVDDYKKRVCGLRLSAAKL